MRGAKVVPETKRADSLLEEFKKDKSHLAVVIRRVWRNMWPCNY